MSNFGRRFRGYIAERRGNLHDSGAGDCRQRGKAERHGRVRKGPRPPFIKIVGAFYPPVPDAWLETARRLPGKALKIASILWRKSVMLDGAAVNITSNDLIEMNVDRSAKRRALDALESAGLIRVERRNGANPIVTVIHDGGEDE